MSYEPTGFSLEIFKSRYAFTQEESWVEACARVAQQVVAAELPAKQAMWREKFTTALQSNQFVPGGRIWANAGRVNASMINCFVLDPEKDSSEGWGQSAYNMIVTSMRGGGCGDDFSDVRPRGASIAGQRGVAPGAVELMRLIDACAQPVRNGGQRRVALMFSLDLEHPDIEEFLNAKLTLGQLTHANVSVRSRHTKAFIKAIENDDEIELHWKGRYKRTIKARSLWNTIVTNAYNSAEPGFMNLELAEQESNIYYINKLVTSNPCFSPETLITTDQGPKPIKDLVGKSVNVISDGKWVEVSNFRVTQQNQPILKITLLSGGVIRVTPDHSMILQSNKRVLARDLKVGDKLKPGVINTIQLNTVVSIEPDGTEEFVYCCTIPNSHSLVLDCNVEVGQCGEIIMTAMEPCCLGHIVLSRFVKDGDINYAELANTIRLGVRFLDNVLSVNHFPLPSMADKSQALRRIGLGTTALADTLVLVGYKYGSVEGNKFIDKLFRFISKIAYEASILLAVEKGPFPLCDPTQHTESGFIKRMPAKIKSLLSENGIRNCAILTQAPTGTVSILSGNCSAGVEPMFAPAYQRRYWENEVRKTQLVFHPLFAQFMREGRDTSHFVSAHELSVRDHLEVQSIIQRHIDNAVSKTINIPESLPMKEMEAAWLEYLPQLKGTTFYRENTRGYVNKQGVVEPPPLVPLTLEQAQEAYVKEQSIVVGGEADCQSGACQL